MREFANICFGSKLLPTVRVVSQIPKFGDASKSPAGDTASPARDAAFPSGDAVVSHWRCIISFRDAHPPHSHPHLPQETPHLPREMCSHLQIARYMTLLLDGSATISIP
jgi:hypothetical protein